MGRSPLLLVLLGLVLSGCSGTRFGEALSGSFSAPPPPAPVPAATTPAPARPTPPVTPPPTTPSPAPAPVAAAPAAKPPATKPSVAKVPAAAAAPYRVTLRLPQADPAAPAEALTQALRAAGVSFTVERIETVGSAASPSPPAAMSTPRQGEGRQLSLRQARRLLDTAYLAAATALLWMALYYLPIGGPLFRLALPLPLALLLLRHGGRCALEGLTVTGLLLVALMGPIRGPLVVFPYGALALWLGWCWRRRCSWWLSLSLGAVIGTAGFLVRVAVLSVLLGENLWVLLTTAAAGLLERLTGLLGLAGTVDLLQVQLAALLLVLLQNAITVLALHAVAYWIFPRLQTPIPEPPPALRDLVALDPL